MYLFSPARPRLPNGLPAWLTAPNTALPSPRVVLLPTHYEGKVLFRVEFMLNGSFKTILTQSVDKILLEWAYSPEAFALSHFNITADERFGQQMSVQTNLDPAELGL